MKILSLHVDQISFKPLKKAIKSIEDISEIEKKGNLIKDALAIFIAVEKYDSNVEAIVAKLIENIKEIAKSVNAKNIVLYPYAHLSSDLASPEVAAEVLNTSEKELKKVKGFKVTKAPFGYYKEFEVKVKGHPLAELSRNINVEEKVENNKEGKEKINEAEEKVDMKNLLRKMEKVKMSTKKPPKGLKSNIELGRDLDLYIVNEVVGQGLPLLTPRGAILKREIEEFAYNEEVKRGYLHTSTPIMASSDLYKISGHWQHYKDDMFVINSRGKKFALRPMTCPFQFILYKRKPRSYKDLPIKYAEIASLFRNEQSGELRGLPRVRQMTLADAHIICRPDQVEEEFAEVLEFLKYIMIKFGIEKDIWYRFSKWDPKNNKKYIQDKKAWESSQKMMKKILDKLKVKYVEAEGEAAFYGPKLDLQYKDVYGKEDTLLTIQIDFALPERYDMTYKDKDNKEKRPMIVHRSSTGTTERMMAFLLEKYQGRLPTWLSPTQVRVLSFTERNVKHAEKVILDLAKNIPNLRIDSDFSNTPIQGKVKEAELMRVPYIIVLGDKEEKENSLAVRVKGDKKIQNFGLEEFSKKIKEEITERK